MKRDKRISFLVTDDEIKKIKVAAGYAGLGVSEYIRELLAKEYAKLNVK